MRAQLLTKVLKMKFLLAKKSKRAFLGSYLSAFKGAGLSFRDFREYGFGDDIRSISWPVTAKMGKPYIKTFEEERGQVFILMVDVSSSSFFGSGRQKHFTLSEAAAMIILLAEQNQDKTGLLLFSDRVERFIPPQKGPRHTMKVIHCLDSFKPEAKRGTRPAPACHYLKNLLKKKSHIFIMSDFLFDDFEKPFHLLKSVHDLTAVIVRDPLERNIPKWGLLDLQDSETGRTELVDTSAPGFQKKYAGAMSQFEKERERDLKKLKIEYFYVRTNQDILKPFLDFMKKKH